MATKSYADWEGERKMGRSAYAIVMGGTVGGGGGGGKSTSGFGRRGALKRGGEGGLLFSLICVRVASKKEKGVAWTDCLSMICAKGKKKEKRENPHTLTAGGGGQIGGKGRRGGKGRLPPLSRPL